MDTDTDIQELANQLAYLYDRWQDERGYEDFADYRTAAAKYVVAVGGTFVKLDKQPFALHFQYSEANKVYDGQLHCTSTDIHFTSKVVFI
jgi:hypothetical protein